ncbi:hypothetical protein DPM19_25955 [Actinomadura craniellae]|uniref:Uncharacterized protein n=1 Tax=Actinomadura craniellae TaxID=2231787 RepID=A0A365GZC2_9ACTN|nr:hypothetical protein [Actinomadura craniellae]RAY12171.1 hypothetical protein DPM19_25955 [Actinomadura craniellae]
MLAEAMLAIAAASGTAVIQAAGTDVWIGFRNRAAKLLGRGDAQRESAELEKLDQTAAALEAAEPAQAELVRVRQEATWQARFEALLESLDDTEREQLADELRALLAEESPAAPGGVTASSGGVAAGGNIDVRADQGSIAAAVIKGGASIGTPPTPDPSQG